MKKVLAITIILFMIFSISTVFGVAEENLLETNTANDILEIKTEVQEELDEYTEKYDSESYGLAAYILNKVRIYSIPVFFIGIIIGALYQYVLGTRRLDMKHKGYGLIMTFVTLLVICQILPLIFTLVVKGWRG